MEEYLRASKLKVSKRLATALCYGILTDTDSFQRDVSELGFNDTELPADAIQVAKTIQHPDFDMSDFDQFDGGLFQFDVV